MYDIKLIRTLILKIDETLKPDDFGVFPEISSMVIAQDERLREYYSQGEILACIQLMFDGGILKPGPKYVNESMNQIVGITLSGYQFLESVRPRTFLEKFSALATSIMPDSAKSFFIEVVKLVNESK